MTWAMFPDYMENLNELSEILKISLTACTSNFLGISVSSKKFVEPGVLLKSRGEPWNLST